MTPWLALACAAPWVPVAIVAARADGDGHHLVLMATAAAMCCAALGVRPKPRGARAAKSPGGVDVAGSAGPASTGKKSGFAAMPENEVQDVGLG